MHTVVEAYSKWLHANKAAVYGVESVVSNITWFLPERFSTSELPAELANSISGLFSVLNEHLLSDAGPTPLQLLLSCVHQVLFSS
jgi:peroxin-16